MVAVAPSTEEMGKTSVKRKETCNPCGWIAKTERSYDLNDARLPEFLTRVIFIHLSIIAR